MNVTFETTPTEIIYNLNMDSIQIIARPYNNHVCKIRQVEI